MMPVFTATRFFSEDLGAALEAEAESQLRLHGLEGACGFTLCRPTSAELEAGGGVEAADLLVDGLEAELGVHGTCPPALALREIDEAAGRGPSLTWKEGVHQVELAGAPALPASLHDGVGLARGGSAARSPVAPAVVAVAAASWGSRAWSRGGRACPGRSPSVPAR